MQHALPIPNLTGPRPLDEGVPSDPLIDILVLLPSTVEHLELGLGLPAETFARILDHVFTGLILPRLKARVID